MNEKQDDNKQLPENEQLSNEESNSELEKKTIESETMNSEVEGKSEDEIKEEVPSKEEDSLESDPESEKTEVSELQTEARAEEADSDTDNSEAAKTENVEEEYEFSEEDDEHQEEDLDKLSKEDLVDRLKELTSKDLGQISEKKVDAIRDAFFTIIDHEREEALQEFLKEEDNSEEDFEFIKNNEVTESFNTYYDSFKDQKKRHHIDLVRLKEENLKKKEELLERLREFVDEEEDNVGIKGLKDIEDEWKKAEPIPNNYTRELWANFNALRDRFYDKRSIFFELKELDRKKNQKLKEELINKAKELLTLNPVNAAVVELKKLHEEYKHIGPVPQEIRGKLWDEFKQISDKVHERKQAVAEEFKKKLDENLENKKELILKLENYISFTSDKISEWNEKSKDVINIQDAWKKIGPVPRELSKEISKSFWSHFKTFFKNKQQFFKSLDEIREKNHEEKLKLCEEVEELSKKENQISEYSNRVKAIQNEWKEIGPAPRKKSEEVYKRFKKACDEFFNQLRGSQKEVEKEFEVNLVKKNEIVEKPKSFSELTQENLEEAVALVEEWNKLGFVPKKAIKFSKNAINEAVEELVKKAKGLTANSIEMAETKLKALLMKGDFHGSRNIGGEIDKLKRQLSKLQDSTVTLKTNMEFFTSTKNAEKLKDDVQQKIDKAEEEMDNLKSKIKMLRQIDK